MNYLFSISIIGSSILLHELGHLLAGLWIQFPIEQFSIGFGPALVSRKVKGITYKLGILPVGGYVLPKLENESDFFNISVKKRLLFTLGGPVFNFLNAIVLFALINTFTQGISFTNLFILPLSQVIQVSYSILNAFSLLFKHPDQLSGVVGVVASGGQYIQNSILNAFTFAAILNINLAIFNLLPVPPLDGGKIVTYTLEAWDKRLSKIQIPLSIAGWALLITIMIFATFKDINALIHSGS